MKGFKIKNIKFGCDDKYMGFGIIEQSFNNSNFLCYPNMRGMCVDTRYGFIPGYREMNENRSTDWGVCTDPNNEFTVKIDFNEKCFVFLLNGEKQVKKAFVNLECESYVFVFDPYFALHKFEVEFFYK